MPSPQNTGVAAPPSRAGVGLRPRHHQRVRDERPAIPWFEVHAENFMAGNMLIEDLDDIARNYPISLHAIGLSLGSATGVNDAHVHALARLIDRYAPCLVSDHLSWSEADGAHLPDLLPSQFEVEPPHGLCKRHYNGGRLCLIQSKSSLAKLASLTRR